MNKEDKIDSVIGKGTSIDGDIRVNGSIKVDGKIEGNIHSKESALIGRDASVKGNIGCRAAVIGGKIQGNINAQELIEFQSGAEMYGDIICKGLIVERGVLFDGNCRMAQETKEKEKQ
ncbi:polymer-forming cytoskeletal protein [candidate division WOR-3 bacterium]|nr:polymer-forming cytoskeletal protein [candidate division WOR-3 bacterium]